MSQNIPGIYNYCDRWCERCCFTDRCAVYEEEKNETAAEKDIQNKAFWDKLAENFQKSIELLHEMAREKGFDLNKIPPEEEERIELKTKKTRSMVKSDPLIIICRDYAMQARKMMENEELWRRKGEEMIQHQRMGVVDIQEIEDQLHLMKECKSVICWYLFFIEVKFSRALSGMIEGWDEKDSIQTDYNGSAKIALVAVNRSREAWTQLYTLIPDEDTVLPILASLSKIDTTAREKFPNAAKFLRPGFDDNIDKAKYITHTHTKPTKY